MNEVEARKFVVDALHKTANVFSNPSISDRLLDPKGKIALKELGLDSLDLVEWSIEIESLTDLTIDPGAIAGIQTIDEFARFLVELEAKSQQPA